MLSKVGGPIMEHPRAAAEFWEVKHLEIFFSKLSLKDTWNQHLTQVISHFLELCGISYKILKLKWHRALKWSTS